MQQLLKRATLAFRNFFSGDQPCETYGNLCFKSIVEGRYEDRGRHPGCLKGCPLDCERVEYRVAVMSGRADADRWGNEYHANYFCFMYSRKKTFVCSHSWARWWEAGGG